MSTDRVGERAHQFIEEWYKAKGWPSENEWFHVCAAFATKEAERIADAIEQKGGERGHLSQTVCKAFATEIRNAAL